MTAVVRKDPRRAAAWGAGGPPPHRRQAWDRFRRNRLAVAGLVAAGVLAVVALAAPLLLRLGVLGDPSGLDIVHAHQGISAAHPLGTDGLGRDLLARTVFGARVSLSIGIGLQVVVVAIGGTVGFVAGYAGGWVDTVLMRVTDLMYAFPDLLFILVVAAVLGPGYWHVVLAVGLVTWPFMARLVRSQVLSVTSHDYVSAARASGSGPVTIVVRHVVPNCLGPVVVTVAFGIPAAIFIEAFLSFVGVGLRPPVPSWGVMISEGYQAVYAFPLEVAVPAAAISLATLSFTLVGDGLRDALAAHVPGRR